MATGVLSRSLSTAGKLQAIGTAFTRSFSSLPSCRNFPSSSSLLRLRPLVKVPPGIQHLYPAAAAAALRGFATRQTYSSLNDTNPNFSNRPPKETILLDGCDFEHWLVVVEKPEGDPTRDEIIDSYIKVLAQVVGSEEVARMKIYSVSTRYYFAFGALVSEEVSYKIKELDKVRWVLPDSYLDVRNKDYGGEPFIDGQAVPYDPKFHEEWVRNNARATERNRRNDRPRNFDRSRNFDRRQMANPNAQNPGPGQNYRPSAGPTQPGSPPGTYQSNNAPMPNQNSNAPWPPTPKNSPPGPPQNNFSPPGPTQNNYSPPTPSQNNHSPSSHGQNYPPVPGQGYSAPAQMQNYPPGPGQNYPPPPPGPRQSYAPPPSPGQSYAPPVQSYSPPPGHGHNNYPPPGPNQGYAPAPNQNQTFTPGPNENYVPNMDGRNAY